MSREDLQKQIAQQQLLSGSYAQEFGGLLSCYGAACFRDDRATMIEIEEKLYRITEKNLDSMRTVAMLTRRLINEQ